MRFLALCLLLLMFFSPVEARQPFDSIRQLQDVHEGGIVHGLCTTWATRLDNMVGTVWVTAAHCFEGVDLKTLLIGGQKATLIKLDPDLDLALLSGPSAPGLRVGFGETPDAGTEITIVGFPRSTVPLMTKGIISNPVLSPGQSAYDSASGPGGSGSPVMVKGYVVVGVVQFGPCEGVCPIEGGASLRSLRDFLGLN